jgi:hypothetical protein
MSEWSIDDVNRGSHISFGPCPDVPKDCMILLVFMFIAVMNVSDFICVTNATVSRTETPKGYLSIKEYTVSGGASVVACDISI